MALDNQDLIFAGLMGSKAVTLIQNANILNNELDNRVLPTIPFLPIKGGNNVSIKPGQGINVEDNWTTRDSIDHQKQFFPLSFSFTGSANTVWLFPYEPMVNISSGNNIVKRNVAKQGDKLTGTIKERWNRKDFDITVTGVLIGSIMRGKPEECFPKDHFVKLFEFLKYSKELFVYCHPLDLLGINKVVVEDYSFPFTKGENVQAYELKLTSDYSYNLLVQEDF